MPTISISVTQEMKTFVEGQVATGQYADPSDYVRDLIRDRQAAVDRVRALIEEGDASGVSPRSFDDILAGIKERHTSRAA
jgi:antitoxin ParD1/3/4